jgi:hypothetical protein
MADRRHAGRRTTIARRTNRMQRALNVTHRRNGQVVNDKLASSVRFHQLEMMSKIYDRLTQKCLTVGHSDRRHSNMQQTT